MATRGASAASLPVRRGLARKPNVVGDVIYAAYEDVLLAEDPFPSVADMFYLAFYPCLVAAFVLLSRRRAQGRDWGGVTDAAIISTGAGVLS